MKTNTRQRGIGIAFAMALAVAGIFSSSVQAVPIQYSGNGHWYELVTTPVNWQDAMTNAAAATCTTCGSGGPSQGYLVTITSAGENDFVASLSTAEFWLAGSDAAVEGVWRWMAGPETGQSFWFGGVGGTSAGTDTGYAAWNPGEPNDANGGEDYLQMRDSSDTWIDVCRDAACSDFGRRISYVVEYTGTPEPATLALLGLGLAGLRFARRRI